MHLLSGNMWVGPTAVTGCELLGAGDWLYNTIESVGGNSIRRSFFSGLSYLQSHTDKGADGEKAKGAG